MLSCTLSDLTLHNNPVRQMQLLMLVYRWKPKVWSGIFFKLFESRDFVLLFFVPWAYFRRPDMWQGYSSWEWNGMEYTGMEQSDLPKSESNSNRTHSSVFISTWYAATLFGRMLSACLFCVWAWYIHWGTRRAWRKARCINRSIRHGPCERLNVWPDHI